MADMLSETEMRTNNEAHARDLGILLEEHKGAEVIVLDIRDMNAWTDFFVIATVSSNTHMEGLDRHIKEFIRDRGLELIRRSPRPGASRDDEWRILDMGTIVVHLMSGRARSFYELERLYPPPSAKIIYSSKSS